MSWLYYALGTLVAGPIAGVVVAGIVLTGATVPKTEAFQDAKSEFKQTSIGQLDMCIDL